MAKRTRWVEFEVPLFVRVQIDDTYDDDGDITKVVLAIPIVDPDGRGAPYDTISMARDDRGHPRVYDGDHAMAPVQDRLADRAVGIAGYRTAWPARRDWEEDEDPRVEIGLYDDEELDETVF